MNKKCTFCNGSCDAPDIHCSIRLHMSIPTLDELRSLLQFSINHLNLLNNLNISYDGNEHYYLLAANYWYEELSNLENEYDNTDKIPKNSRKFIVHRIRSFRY